MQEWASLAAAETIPTLTHEAIFDLSDSVIPTEHAQAKRWAGERRNLAFSSCYTNPAATSEASPKGILLAHNE
jgi:hypothetical protein